MLEPRRYSQSKITRMIQEQLPGVHFSIEQRSDEFLTVLLWERRVEGFRVAIDDIQLHGRDGEEVLSYSAQRAIEDQREKALKDYGLREILEREKAEAYKEGHRAGFKVMLENLKKYIDKEMVYYADVQNEETQELEYVPVGHNREGQLLTDWLAQFES